MKKIFETTGTCSKTIILDIDKQAGIINGIRFIGGCSGNTQGIAALVKGQKMEDVIARLKGIRCGTKPTSCPDQLAKALAEIVSERDNVLQTEDISD
jgi:uncharacterized protein (TIGR03905 family)